MKELGTFDNSPIRYPGGKGQRSIRLLRLVDQTRKHYVEAFSGGLGMLYRARRERLFKTYQANDLDANLINFYVILRDHPEELIEQLWNCYRHHGAGDDELFHQSRENIESDHDIERAVAYFIVNRWSVKGDLGGGMLRTTKRRNGLSPMILDRLPLYSELLNGVTLSCMDYREIEVPRNTYAFIDPPYERVGSSLYKHRVNLDEFGVWAKHLNCSWMITLNNSKLTNNLFADFDRVVEPVNYPAIVNPMFSTHERRNTTELVIMNYHLATRDAFIRSYGWSVIKAGRHHNAA